MTKDPSLKKLGHYLKEHRLEDAFPKEIWDYIELQHYNTGEFICLAGEPVNYFSVLIEGRCHVMPLSEGGKTVVLSHLSPISLVGDIEMFNSCPALYSVCAVLPTTSIAISKTHFFSQMMQVPGFLQFLCMRFAEKLYSSSIKHSTSMLYPIKTRLIRIFFELSADKQSTNINIQQQELAQYLGITTRHLRRVLMQLEQSGLILRNGNVVTLLDKTKLAHEAGNFH